MSGQCIAVVGCNADNSSLSSELVIKGIFEVEELKESPLKYEYYSTYPWNITNKYYSATVDICHVKQKNMIGQQFANEVEAVIALFDSRKEAKSLTSLESWLSYFDVWEPEIKLAVCECCASVDDSDSGFMNREEVQSWCLDKGFELIELNPVLDDYDEEEDYGMKRIRNALYAHMWPKMEMKSKETNGIAHENKNDVPQSSEEETKPDPPSVEERINSLLTDSDFPSEFDDDFETLFQKMRVFKDTAASKSGSSRMDYAEQVVTAFWKAIGGDENELRDSSDEG